MEKLDVAGTFWQAGKPDRKVAGRLTFNNADGLELNLIGSLHELTEVLDQLTEPVVSVPSEELHGPISESVRILGETTKGHVTLDHCLRKSGSFPLIGPRRPAQETYLCDVALLHAHFDEDEPLVFTGVRTRIQNLEHWVGTSSVGIEFDYDEKSKEIEQIRIINTPREKMVTQTCLGELELIFKYSLVGDHIVESTIRQSHVLEFRFSEPQSLRDTVGVCTSLRDLVTIGVDSPVSIDGVSLMHADLDRPVDFYAQFIGTGYQAVGKPPHPREMLFTFEGLGGLQGVAKWLDVAQKYKLVISMLLSPQYRPPWYAEHRFFDSITALETLARVQLQEEHINRHKLKQLGHEMGDILKALVGDVDHWIDLVWDARRDNLVHRDLQEGENPPLHLLAESLYFLVVFCLLKECEVTDSALESIQTHKRFCHVSNKLRVM